jgi:hypothetical protein
MRVNKLTILRGNSDEIRGWELLGILESMDLHRVEVQFDFELERLGGFLAPPQEPTLLTLAYNVCLDIVVEFLNQPNAFGLQRGRH